jgi:hypothetical protein
MAEQFGWSKSTSGFVLSSFFYGYLCTQILGGYLAYRFGGKPLLGVVRNFVIDCLKLKCRVVHYGRYSQLLRLWLLPTC